MNRLLFTRIIGAHNINSINWLVERLYYKCYTNTIESFITCDFKQPLNYAIRDEVITYSRYKELLNKEKYEQS